LLKSYTGVYEDEGVERLLTLENGKLYYQRAGANRMAMKPYARDKFFFENTGVLGEFKRDANNKITSLLLVNKRGVSSSLLTRTEKQIPAPQNRQGSLRVLGRRSRNIVERSTHCCLN